MISTTSNYHWVKTISAAHRTHNALTLTFHGDREAGDCQHNEADVTLFMDDADLVDRLVSAINSVKVEPKIEQMEVA